MSYNSAETNEKITLYVPPFSRIKSYFEMIDVAVEYGIKNLETFNMFELEKPDYNAAREVRNYADKKGVKIVCVSVGVNLVGDDRDEQMDFAKKYVEMAKILGSPYMHHTIANYYQNPDDVVAKRKEYFPKGIEAVSELYDFADKSSIRIIHEEQGFIFNGKEAFLELFEKTQRNTGVVADFGNILYADEVVEDFIPTVADRIVHAHLKDFKFFPSVSRDAVDYEKEVDRYKKSCAETKGHNFLQKVPLGQGVVDFEAGFIELKKINFDGYIALECPIVNSETEIKDFESNLRFANNCIETML